MLGAQGTALELTIYGDGKDFDLFRTRAQALALTPPTVHFRGQLPNDVALADLADAHVGIIPHWRDEQFDNTVPNKLFDYMAAGLAVVTSHATQSNRNVATRPCGRVVPQ